MLHLLFCGVGGVAWYGWVVDDEGARVRKISVCGGTGVVEVLLWSDIDGRGVVGVVLDV